MELVLVFSILLIQAVMMYQSSGSWLFPPALYNLYWALIILSSTVLRFGDYALTFDGLLVFLVGGVVFMVGGLVAVLCLGCRLPAEPTSERRKKFIQSCILFYSIGLVALVPIFIIVLLRSSRELGIIEFAVASRVALGEGDRTGIPHYFQSLTSIGATLAYCAAWLYKGSRRDKLILLMATTATLAMSVLTFARTPVYMLIVGVLGILGFRKTIRHRTVVVFIVLTVVLALVIGVALGKGPKFGADSSIMTAVVENLAVYFVGGPVGFAQIMEIPTSVGERGLSLRFFTQAAQSLGIDIELPNNILGEFSDAFGNVYTIYFAYWLDGGWGGVVAMAFLAGFFCTSLYLLARKDHPMAGIALGVVIASILNSATGDGIFGSSVPWLLILIVVGFLWNIPIVSFRFSKRPTLDTSQG